jgi:hydroxymethylbilane synthase
MLRARPDLVAADIRGNVDTRLRLLERSSEWTAILLAVAGLVRLGQAGRIGERLPLDLMLPAPGQAALAAVTRDADAFAAAAVRAAIHHLPTAWATAAERAVLAGLGGGCDVPIAAFGTIVCRAKSLSLHLTSRVLGFDGSTVLEAEVESPVASADEAVAVGAALADGLRRDGAAQMLAFAGRGA